MSISADGIPETPASVCVRVLFFINRTTGFGASRTELMVLTDSAPQVVRGKRSRLLLEKQPSRTQRSMNRGAPQYTVSPPHALPHPLWTSLPPRNANHDALPRAVTRETPLRRPHYRGRSTYRSRYNSAAGVLYLTEIR